MIEVQATASASRELQRHVWMLRLIGGVLLVAGWLAMALEDTSLTHLVTTTAIFGGLGAYAFLAAARGRRVAVNLERKLRLGLLVHNMELESMAMQDDLTQLFNRRYLFERLDRELQTARAFDRPLSVIVLDMDLMKSVNDTYGHRAGDELLAKFGRFLLDHTRASDIPARIGGDEFAIILPDTSERAATILMHRLAKKLENTTMIEDGKVSIKVSVSVGLSGYPHGGSTVDAIMQKADAAMYANKHEHKMAAGPEEAGNGQLREAVTAVPHKAERGKA
jgi:diguanylate cyclase (GGDEF)-like protein